MTPEELQAYHDKVEAALKVEGFASVEALATDRNKAQAAKTKAEEVRDTLSAQVESANELVRNRGAEVGTKQVEIDQLAADKAQLEKDLVEARAGIKPAPGTPPADEKTPAEQLLVLETQMTEAHWDEADKILENMTVEDAAEAATPSKIRLELVRGILNDPELNQLTKPKSLRPAAAPVAPAEDAYARYKKEKTQGGQGPRGLPSGGGTKPAFNPRKTWVKS